MYLSRAAEYALRSMAYLARCDPAHRVRAEDLAAAVDIPHSYLSKILRRLTAAGLLTSMKGHRGGFALAKHPATVRFVDILRAVEFEPAPDRCLFGWDNCGEHDPCPLHFEWASLKEAIEEWARSRRLSDVLEARGAPRGRERDTLVRISS